MPVPKHMYLRQINILYVLGIVIDKALGMGLSMNIGPLKALSCIKSCTNYPLLDAKSMISLYSVFGDLFMILRLLRTWPSNKEQENHKNKFNLT